MKVQSPQHVFYDWLAKRLEKAEVTPEQARAVSSAVEGLSPDAPLTLEMIQGLGLDPGVEANLIFAWLHHRYPDEVEGQLAAAESLSEVVRSLIAGDEVPEFALEFHQRLLEKRGPERAPTARGLDILVEESRLSLFGEKQGKVVFVAKHEAEEHSIAIELGDKNAARVSWDGGQCNLSELSPDTLERFSVALRRGAKNASLGKDGLRLEKAVGELKGGQGASPHPVMNRLETLLRLELGGQGVGESKLGTLNGLIGQILKLSQDTLDNPQAADVADQALDDIFSRKRRGPQQGSSDANGDEAAPVKKKKGGDESVSNKMVADKPAFHDVKGRDGGHRKLEGSLVGLDELVRVLEDMSQTIRDSRR